MPKSPSKYKRIVQPVNDTDSESDEDKESEQGSPDKRSKKPGTKPKKDDKRVPFREKRLNVQVRKKKEVPSESDEDSENSDDQDSESSESGNKKVAVKRKLARKKPKRVAAKRPTKPLKKVELEESEDDEDNEDEDDYTSSESDEKEAPVKRRRKMEQRGQSKPKTKKKSLAKPQMKRSTTTTRDEESVSTNSGDEEDEPSSDRDSSDEVEIAVVKQKTPAKSKTNDNTKHKVKSKAQIRKEKVASDKSGEETDSSDASSKLDEDEEKDTTNESSGDKIKLGRGDINSFESGGGENIQGEFDNDIWDATLMEIANCSGCGALFDEPCPCDKLLGSVPEVELISAKDDTDDVANMETLPLRTPSPKNKTPTKACTSTPTPTSSSSDGRNPKKRKASPCPWVSPSKKIICPESESDSDSNLKNKNASIVDMDEDIDEDLKNHGEDELDIASEEENSELEIVPAPEDTQSSSSESEISRSENESEDETIPARQVNSQQPLVDTLTLVPKLKKCAGPTYIEQKINSKIEFSIELYRLTKFGRRISYPASDFVEFLKSIPIIYRKYDVENNLFLFPMNYKLYKKILSKLEDLDYDIEEIKLIDLESTFPFREEINCLDRAVKALSKYRRLNIEQEDYARNPNVLDLFSGFPSIQQHQMEAVQFAISRHGSCILADEQKLGKRVEALVTCKYYEDEWPIMITCATAKVGNWIDLLTTAATETEIGLGIPKELIIVVETEEACLELQDLTQDKYSAVIMTYPLLLSKSRKTKKSKFNFKSMMEGKVFKLLVVDESHRIKHQQTQTSRAMKHLIKRSKRRLFLTDNPSFAVPRELFYQLHCIQREIFKNYDDFANQYCGWEVNPTTNKVIVSRSWRHAKNLSELKHIMFGTLIYRNFRSDISKCLPNLVREKINLHSKLDPRTQRLLGSVNFKEAQECQNALEFDRKNKSIFKWFRKSGTAKLLEVCKYLDSIDYKKRKVVIYAHHKKVIKGIEKLLETKGIHFVKIEGDYDTRRDLSQQFHQTKVGVALLSLRRSTHDINLQCADLVVFTELLWVPDNLFRNENRTYKFNITSRKTARRTIDIKYLFASEKAPDGSELYIDDCLWEMLSGKMDVLKTLGLLKEDFMDQVTENTFHGLPSSIIDDLVLSDMDEHGSSDEYSPSESDEQDETPEEYELDDSSASENENDLAITSESEEGDDNDEKAEVDVSDHNPEPDSSENEKENVPEPKFEIYSSNHSESLGETDTDEDDSNEDDDNGSDLESFVASNSSGEEEEEEDPDYDPNKKKSRKKKTAIKTKESSSETESESDDENYEQEISKSTRGFVR